jgi:hypothetical protein
VAGFILPWQLGKENICCKVSLQTEHSIWTLTICLMWAEKGTRPSNHYCLLQPGVFHLLTALTDRIRMLTTYFCVIDPKEMMVIVY